MHVALTQLLTTRIEPRPKQRPARNLRLLHIRPDRLRHPKIHPHRLLVIALMRQPDRCPVIILMKVRHLEATARRDPRPGMEIKRQIARSRHANSESPFGILMSCRGRAMVSALVSSTASAVSRAMNCDCAGFDTLTGTRNSAALPVRLVTRFPAKVEEHYWESRAKA